MLTKLLSVASSWNRRLWGELVSYVLPALNEKMQKTQHLPSFTLEKVTAFGCVNLRQHPFGPQASVWISVGSLELLLDIQSSPISMRDNSFIHPQEKSPKRNRQLYPCSLNDRDINPSSKSLSTISDHQSRHFFTWGRFRHKVLLPQQRMFCVPLSWITQASPGYILKWHRTLQLHLVGTKWNLLSFWVPFLMSRTVASRSVLSRGLSSKCISCVVALTCLSPLISNCVESRSRQIIAWRPSTNAEKQTEDFVASNVDACDQRDENCVRNRIFLQKKTKCSSEGFWSEQTCEGIDQQLNAGDWEVLVWVPTCVYEARTEAVQHRIFVLLCSSVMTLWCGGKSWACCPNVSQSRNLDSTFPQILLVLGKTCRRVLTSARTP